ncbi:MAG: hypothetical protein OXC40_02765, partial [Proteobacteria bacterium]|nr:hypothetical protein [Pseudomonadota bacterium]
MSSQPLDHYHLGLEHMASLLEPSNKACEVQYSQAKKKVTTQVPCSSKSIAIRAMILAALSRGYSEISPIPTCHDTKACLLALKSLGIKYQQLDNRLLIQGDGAPFKARRCTLNLAGSGITSRFLTACLAAGSGGSYYLNGNHSLRTRNSQPLIQALTQLSDNTGDVFNYPTSNSLPVIITPQGLLGGSIVLPPDATQSSQFLSALLLASPLAKQPVTIT